MFNDGSGQHGGTDGDALAPQDAHAPDERPDDGPRRTLSVETVVDAADAVARRHGATRMTMRLVAEELGVSAMAAYRYIDGRAQLGALLLDRIFAGLRADEEVPLDQALEAAARALGQRPGLAAELDEEAIATQPHVRAWITELELRLHPPGARAALWLVRGAAHDRDALPWLRLLAGSLDAASDPTP